MSARGRWSLPRSPRWWYFRSAGLVLRRRVPSGRACTGLSPDEGATEALVSAEAGYQRRPPTQTGTLEAADVSGSPPPSHAPSRYLLKCWHHCSKVSRGATISTRRWQLGGGSSMVTLKVESQASLSAFPNTTAKHRDVETDSLICWFLLKAPQRV